LFGTAEATVKLLLSVVFIFLVFYRGFILKATVIAVVLLLRGATGCCFTGQFIMIGNSVPSRLRATAHGFAMTAVCAAR
jgi:hypothetical protein